jgi:hypothetical protein
MEIAMTAHLFSWISTLRSAAWFSPLGAIRMPEKTSIKASGAAPHSALIAELSMDADHGLQSLSARFQFTGRSRQSAQGRTRPSAAAAAAQIFSRAVSLTD